MSIYVMFCQVVILSHVMSCYIRRGQGQVKLGFVGIYQVRSGCQARLCYVRLCHVQVISG